MNNKKRSNNNNNNIQKYHNNKNNHKDNNSTIKINNNNNNKINNSHIDFLKHIWRNKYIKSEILKYYINSKVYVTSRDQLLNDENRNYIKTLICDIPEPESLQIDDIPESVKVLVLLERCEQPKTTGVIPGTVETLYYGVDLELLQHQYHFKIRQFKNLSGRFKTIESKKLLFTSFNEPLKVGVLPSNGRLKTIIFGNKISQVIIPGSIPNTIESIIFGTRYNNKFKENSLSCCKLVKFGTDFDQPLLKKLPESLETIIFSSNSEFNQDLLPGDIPFKVHTLVFGQKFNRDNINLPPSITSLTFGDWYSKIITPNSLPPYLTQLHFSRSFNQSNIKQLIPSTVKNLSLGFHFNQNIGIDDLPVELEFLTLSNYFNRLIRVGSTSIFKNCNNLHTIIFGNGFNKQIYENDLPVSLTSLTLGNSFNFSLSKGILPSNIQTLVIGNGFNQIINENDLPASLVSLSIGNRFDHPWKKSILPSNIQTLVIGNGFNQIINDLPVNLTSLSLGDSFNYPFADGVLPNSITSLSVGYKFNQNSYKLLKALPRLEKLKIGDEFDPKFKNAIPTSLHTIKVPTNYPIHNLILNNNNNNNNNNCNNIKIKTY